MSTVYSISPQNLIRKALIKQGWLDYTQTVDSTKQADMLDSLNIMIKAWSSKGIKLWTIENVTLPLQANKTSYNIGPTGTDLVTDRPLRIEDAPTLLNLSSGNSYELMRMARYDYLTLGNKTQSLGQPSNFFYDDLIPNGVLYLYVTPDNNTAQNFVAQLPIRRYIDDINSLTDVMDFPSEWYQALLWGLASETAMDGQIPEKTVMWLEKQAAMYIAQLEDWDREWAPVSFAPDRRGSGTGSMTQP